MSLAYNAGALPTFNNQGTLVVAAGKTLTVSSTRFINAGTGVINNAGVVDFNGSNATFDAGSTLTGAGAININSNASFNGAFSATNLMINGGAVSGNAVVASGTLGWTGGVLTGGWQLANGQTLNAGSGGNKILSAAAFDNRGSVNWNTTDSLFLQSGTVFDNTGTFAVNESMSLSSNAGALPTFNNQGMLLVAAGKTLTVGSARFVNAGTGVINTAGVVNFIGSNATFDAGSNLTGSGVVNINSNAVFNGGFHAANLMINSGTVTGNAAVAGGTLGWTGGVLTGDWQLASGRTLNAGTGGNKILSAAAFDNRGSINWNTSDSLFLQSGTVFDNNSTFAVNESMSLTYNAGALPIFNNRGMLRVAAGKTLTVGSASFVNAGGGVINNAGVVNFIGSNATFDAGSTLIGSGVVNINSNAVFNGAFSATNLALNSGTVTGNAAIASGTVGWTGGVVTGGWQLANGQTLNAGSGGNKILSAAAFDNRGAVNWNTADSLFLQSGATLTNRGLIDFRTDSAVVYNAGAAPTFVNTGVIRKSGGAGTTTIGTGTGFDNQGVVEVQTGTIALPANFVNNGTLKGVGAFSTNLITNNGRVAPGASPGTLTIDGNFAQGAAGFFDVELNSLATHDLLLVNGSAALTGTLALQCFGACSLAVGNELVILDATGALTGTFAQTTLAGFGAGAFDVVYDRSGSRVLLRVTEASVAAVPEPGTYAMMLAGLFLVGTIVRQRRRLVS